MGKSSKKDKKEKIPAKKKSIDKKTPKKHQSRSSSVEQKEP